jgi:DNA gyrase/topoisomerase IV subunit A
MLKKLRNDYNSVGLFDGVINVDGKELIFRMKAQNEESAKNKLISIYKNTVEQNANSIIKIDLRRIKKLDKKFIKFCV